MKIFTSIGKIIFKDFLYFVILEYFPLQPQVFSNLMTFLLLIWMMEVYIAGGENFCCQKSWHIAGNTGRGSC